jgi:DNA-binding transcriptional ArsR family regulator
MERVNEVERILLGLAEQTRLRILNILKDGEADVSTITDLLGLAQPKVSRHLAYLKDSGVATARRDGKQIYYSLADRSRSSAIVLAVLSELMGAKTTNERARNITEREQPDHTSVQPHTFPDHEEMETYLL